MRNLVLTLIVSGLFSGVAAAAPTPKMLVEISDLSDVAIAPDGTVAAFRSEAASVERNTYDSSWFVVALDGGRPARRIADGGAPLRYNWGPSIIEPPVWSPDSQWIYYRALLDGQVQVWRAARDGSRAEPVTTDAADVQSFSLSADGDSLLYVVGAAREDIRRAEDDEDDHGVRIDETVWVGAPLVRSGMINGRLATQRYAGKGFETAGLLSDQPKRSRLVDLKTLNTRDSSDADRALFAAAAGHQAPAAAAVAASIARSPTSAWSAYLSARTDNRNMHKRKTLEAFAGSAEIVCSDPVCQDADIASLGWRPGSDEVVFTVTDHARGRAQSLYGWDVQANRVRLIVRAEGLLNGGRVESGETPCSIGKQFAVCVSAAANRPPHLERLDLRTGARAVLVDPNAALHDASAPVVSFLTWQDGKGHTFTGQFFAPNQNPPGKPAPLFITYYGCPGYVRGGSPGDEWPLAPFAEVGIAALCINAPFDLPLEATERYDTALSAVRSAIDLLARRRIVDRTRVGMGGLSFGSEVTLWVAMKSDLLAATSVASPLASQTYYWFMSLKGEKQLAVLRNAWGLGAPAETPERWKLLSPSYNVAQIHAPVLMQMPEQEYLNTVDYFAPLARSSTPAEMFVFPNESHQKVMPRHKLAAYERNLDWFRFWLQDYADPDPHKADQYARWRAEKLRADQAHALGAPAKTSGARGG